MLSNIVKALLFSSVLQLVGTSLVGARNDFDKLRSGRVAARRVGLVKSAEEASIVRRQDWGSSASASASASASVNAQVMLQSWSSLAAAADQCQEVFQQEASLQVALQAATTFSNQAMVVNRQAGRCACDALPSDVSTSYQASIVQLFSSLQVVLQVGAERFGADWESRFKPVFQRVSSTLASMKQICAQLHIDLAVTLRQAHLDLGLFLGVGLNVNALLGLNLQIGGLLSL